MIQWRTTPRSSKYPETEGIAAVTRRPLAASSAACCRGSSGVSTTIGTAGAARRSEATSSEAI